MQSKMFDFFQEAKTDFFQVLDIFLYLLGALDILCLLGKTESSTREGGVAGKTFQDFKINSKFKIMYDAL